MWAFACGHSTWAGFQSKRETYRIVRYLYHDIVPAQEGTLGSSSSSWLRGALESLGQPQEPEQEGGPEAEAAGHSEPLVRSALGGTSRSLDMKGVKWLPWSVSGTRTCIRAFSSSFLSIPNFANMVKFFKREKGPMKLFDCLPVQLEGSFPVSQELCSRLLWGTVDMCLKAQDPEHCCSEKLEVEWKIDSIHAANV